VISLLLSFCNLPAPRNTALMKLDLDSETALTVELGWKGLIKSCTGLFANHEKIYVLFESEGTDYVAGLGRVDLSPVFIQPLSEVKQGHSIFIKDTNFYVVSTGSDKVFRYDLGPPGLSNPIVVWQASNFETDTHHINSIAEWQGNLIISAFGPKFGTLWSSAFDGYIHDISRDRCVKTGIYHPHSLAALGDRLYYIESYRSFYGASKVPSVVLMLIRVASVGPRST
jgi:hypothetical protein